jgi:hypothetical protein
MDLCRMCRREGMPEWKAGESVDRVAAPDTRECQVCGFMELRKVPYSMEAMEQLAKVFARLCYDLDTVRGAAGYMRQGSVDCVAIEESCMYDGLIEDLIGAETPTVERVEAMMDWPEWKGFRKAMYEEYGRIAAVAQAGGGTA